MITDHSTLEEVERMLAYAGLRVRSVQAREGKYYVTLALDEAHVVGGVSLFCGSAPTLGAALEAARATCANWHALCRDVEREVSRESR